MSKDDDAAGKTVRPTSMVAPLPPVPGRLQTIDELAAERGVPAPQLAGMCRANNWAEGKQLTAAQFETAMTSYAQRRMGAGRN